MAPKEKPGKADMAEGPEAARALRESLGMTKEKFAQALGVSRIAVLFWEKGRSEPSADTYIRLAKLATERGLPALGFWQAAGINDAALQQLSPEIRRSFREFEKRMRDDPGSDTVRVPVLKGIKHISTPPLAPASEIEAWLPLPASLVPNPRATGCLQLPDDSQLSVLGGKDLVLVDGSDNSFDGLWAEMVAVYHTREEGRQRKGIYVGWLQPYPSQGEDRIVPVLSVTRTLEEAAALGQFDFHIPVPKGRRVKEIVVSALAHAIQNDWVIAIGPNWRVLGRVICWIAAPKPRDQGAK